MMREYAIVLYLLALLVSAGAYARTLFPEQIEDRLNGVAYRYQEGWSHKRLSGGVVISNMRVHVVIRGLPTADIAKGAKLLMEEARRLSLGQTNHSYRKYPNYYVFYSEGLRYPHEVLQLNFVRPDLSNLRYSRLSFLVPGKKVVLDVSVFIPEDIKPQEKRELSAVLQSIEFLPANRRVNWKYFQVYDQALGMPASRIPVPEGYSISAGTVKEGTLRDYVYNITSGKNSIRKDTISVQASISNIMGNLSQASLLTINGASSQQPNYLCVKSPDMLEKFLLAVSKAAFGKSWSVVEREHREKDAWQEAFIYGVPPIPNYTPLSFYGALLLRTDDGMIYRLMFYRLMGGYGTSGSWMDRSEFCQFSVKLIIYTSDSVEGLKELSKIGNGIYAGEEVNPEWVLRVVRESQKENIELNRTIAKIQKENREYNSWMANSWANLLSDQTYVRDPSTGEVFRIYKESWRTGEFWREPVFGDVILGGVREGSKLQELLKTEGWRRLDESLGGFK